MAEIIEQIIIDQIENNKANFAEDILAKEAANPNANTQYNQGYREGYHDALVDLLSILNIEHKYEIFNQ